MGEKLLSLGLDVGTTSTQMVFSELEIENRAGSFSVPQMQITGRRIRYRGGIHFTPLISGELVDAEALKKIVDGEYRAAGIEKHQVDTGAIIITGETSRKENARAVLDALSDYAGEFVVATAGPELESVLAAKGAGAVAHSAMTGQTILHMDIGGGTSNLALMEDGTIRATGCFNVGGRLVKIREDGVITYVSPVLAGIFDGKEGEVTDSEEMRELAEKLVGALEAAAGFREERELMDKLRTAGTSWTPPKGPVKLSFSGGVADCIEKELPDLTFGDLGPVLGQAIRRSRLCAGDYMLGAETIRATVIGAGSHSTQLSGSTVYHQNIVFPLKNLPVVRSAAELKGLDGPGVLALEGIQKPDYGIFRI